MKIITKLLNLNLINISKFHLLSELTNNKYIEDPWYTNKFLDTYLSIKKNVICIIDNLINLNK